MTYIANVVSLYPSISRRGPLVSAVFFDKPGVFIYHKGYFYVEH